MRSSSAGLLGLFADSGVWKAAGENPAVAAGREAAATGGRAAMGGGGGAAAAGAAAGSSHVGAREAAAALPKFGRDEAAGAPGTGRGADGIAGLGAPAGGGTARLSSAISTLPIGW